MWNANFYNSTIRYNTFKNKNPKYIWLAFNAFSVTSETSEQTKICAWAEKQANFRWNCKGRFHVTDITFREQIFGKKTFFYILFLRSFCLKFVQIFITWYLIVSMKETLISFTKAVNIFVLNSVTDITKKSTTNFACSSWQCYSCELACETLIL